MNDSRGKKAQYDVPAVRKTLQLLKALAAANRPLGVSEISRAIDSNKNMTFRLLTTLVDEGWIVAEEPGPGYRLTLMPFQVACQVVHGWSLRDAAAGPMRLLWDELGESLYLAVLHDDAALYIEHLDSRQDVRIAGMLGGRYPLHCSAPGKVLLAHAPDELFERLVAAGLERRTENTLTTRESLGEDLARVRRRGYALDLEEFGRGILCFAVPIFDHSGKVVAACGTSVTTVAHARETLVERLGPRILATGREISQRLGYSLTNSCADSDKPAG